jgi:hypothetical protein
MQSIVFAFTWIDPYIPQITGKISERYILLREMVNEKRIIFTFMQKSNIAP